MIDLEKLRSFYYVIKEGSLLKAARALDKNHTTLSKHITDLEQSYKVKLFIRKRKQLELTDKGQELFTLAQSTIPNLENGATEILSKSSNSPSNLNSLRIITTTGVIGVWVIRKINELKKEFPDLRPAVITTTSNMDLDFESSRADVGILPKLHSKSLSFKKVRTVQHALYASREYLDKYGTPETLEDLKDHKLISYYSGLEGSLGNIDWHLSRGLPNNTFRESALSVNSGFLIFEAGCQNMGIISTMKGFEYINTSDLVRILPNETGPLMECFFITRKNSVLSPVQKRFLEILSEENC